MKTLCVEQVKAILNKARQSSTRDWCAFLLTFRHALRSQEVRQLKLTDVDTSNLTITISRVDDSRGVNNRLRGTSVDSARGPSGGHHRFSPVLPSAGCP